MAVEKPIALDLKLETVIVDKLPIAVSMRIRDEYPAVAENMKVVSHRLYNLSETVSYTFLSFLSNIHRQDKAEFTLYEYPATPWDFFKVKYAPEWFLKRWPVRYETQKIPTRVEKNFMCPHLVERDNYPHIYWMQHGLNSEG